MQRVNKHGHGSMDAAMSSANQRPCAQEGPTTFIADDRGHLLPGVKKRGNAWPDFKGTWDLPARIVPGRSAEGLRRLKSSAFEPQHSVCKNTGSLQDVGEHAMQLAEKQLHPPTRHTETSIKATERLS
uniref:protein Flattop n=1 Tax=Gasterosteus aculeatus aculeatus TaxID=481459 RepID=UPI001A99C0DC|nr:protein Flattop [Gasterosteus aculeatus aculeatus]